jgi:two-component system response regulator FixJ
MLAEPTVFIVDDDPAACKSLCALVKSRGLTAETFSSGEEFQQPVEVDRAGVLITDLRMGAVSGIDLQEHLNGCGSLLPVIVVSGHADVPATVRLMQNGALTLLQKPYQECDVLAAIDRALRQNKQARQRKGRLKDTGSRLAALSKPELRILELMLEGLPNKHISKELGTSLRTVDRRRRSVLDKMQAESIAELVQMVAEHRLAQGQLNSELQPPIAVTGPSTLRN